MGSNPNNVVMSTLAVHMSPRDQDAHAGAGDERWARRVPPTAVDVDRARRIEKLRKLAVLMDSSIRVPGLKFKIGLDPIIGLMPGVGDIVTTGISAYIVYQGYKLGASKTTIAKMIGNMVIDGVVGEIPLLGDVFDFAFKANVRNLKLLGIDVKGSGVEFDPAASMGGR